MKTFLEYCQRDIVLENIVSFIIEYNIDPRIVIADLTEKILLEVDTDEDRNNILLIENVILQELDATQPGQFAQGVNNFTTKIGAGIGHVLGGIKNAVNAGKQAYQNITQQGQQQQSPANDVLNLFVKFRDAVTKAGLGNYLNRSLDTLAGEINSSLDQAGQQQQQQQSPPSSGNQVVQQPAGSVPPVQQPNNQQQETPQQMKEKVRQLAYQKSQQRGGQSTPEQQKQDFEQAAKEIYSNQKIESLRKLVGDLINEI